MNIKPENNSSRKGTIKYQFKSFRYAFSGLVFFFTMEQKATIHTAFAFIAILSGFLLKLTSAEWCFVVIAIVVVFIAEILNSVIEQMVDMVHPEKSKQAGIIKDMAAGAVLFSSIGALVIGIIIYFPKILHMIV